MIKNFLKITLNLPLKFFNDILHFVQNTTKKYNQCLFIPQQTF